MKKESEKCGGMNLEIGKDNKISKEIRSLFGSKFQVLLFKMIWKLWFKECCENIFYNVKNVFGTMFQITYFKMWKYIDDAT